MDSSERENGGSSDEQNNTGDEDKNDLDSSGDAEEIKRRRIQQSPSKKGFMVSGNHYDIPLLIPNVQEVRTLSRD